MAERTVRVESEVGLHARPAATFVQTASKAPIDVTLSKAGGAPVSAKSILAVLALDVRHGEQITLRAEGEGAEELLDELSRIVSETK
ncbi:HPr family phosphocarrier protein [Bailinhaonella thermotolerans]|uniref:Phosphocarrier protein HPr n=1 Tax=Bailinhaonella thermotolerans TaxID=1070861 RepID=A0A3A4AT18_9ACTN|nr:HPr family phosphocarrier protein [Bailinhaonella thermotolerans]RJL30444.1 HPr family phosphocarrier protein [Bailinhaonella thermotolerans]